MKCINCEVEVENDDNFCHKCGHWTAKGYSFLKDKENIKMINEGYVVKQNEKLSLLLFLVVITLLLFAGMMFFRGENLFRPLIYLKKQITNYMYEYNTSIMKTDNKYSNVYVNTYEEAIETIKDDFAKQSWLCDADIEVSRIEYNLQNNFNIPSVSFCDISYDTAEKLDKVINKFYDLFPSIKGALTNITVTNASSNENYIAYFQPLYQFVNIDENINDFNKVNKTQILLNSYYFLNDDILSKPIEEITGQNWYVKGATWDSTLAHELGHYLSFVILLKNNGLDNITWETNSNYSKIKEVIVAFNSGKFSREILDEAIANYNEKYETSINANEFALTISKYAGSKDNKGILIADETIAEAVHDYYLNGSNMQNSSKEIISVLKDKLRSV